MVGIIIRQPAERQCHKTFHKSHFGKFRIQKSLTFVLAGYYNSWKHASTENISQVCVAEKSRYISSAIFTGAKDFGYEFKILWKIINVELWYFHFLETQMKTVFAFPSCTILQKCYWIDVLRWQASVICMKLYRLTWQNRKKTLSIAWISKKSFWRLYVMLVLILTAQEAMENFVFRDNLQGIQIFCQTA